MKKQQLQELVEEQQTTISELRKQISELKEQHTQEIDTLNKVLRKCNIQTGNNRTRNFLTNI